MTVKPSRSRPSAGQRVVLLAAASLAVAALAAASFVLTFDDLRTLALRGGAARQYAQLYPAMFDVTVVVTLLSLLVARWAGWWARRLRELVLLLLLSAIAAASVQRSVVGYEPLPEKWVKIGVATAPVIILLISVWLWLAMFRHAWQAYAGRTTGVAPPSPPHSPQGSHPEHPDHGEHGQTDRNNQPGPGEYAAWGGPGSQPGAADWQPQAAPAGWSQPAGSADWGQQPVPADWGQQSAPAGWSAESADVASQQSGSEQTAPMPQSDPLTPTEAPPAFGAGTADADAAPAEPAAASYDHADTPAEESEPGLPAPPVPTDVRLVSRRPERADAEVSADPTPTIPDGIPIGSLAAPDDNAPAAADEAPVTAAGATSETDPATEPDRAPQPADQAGDQSEERAEDGTVTEWSEAAAKDVEKWAREADSYVDSEPDANSSAQPDDTGEGDTMPGTPPSSTFRSSPTPPED